MSLTFFEDLNLRLIQFKKGYQTGFNNLDDRQFFLGRQHFGTYIAMIMATYNLYQIRQKIIKQSILITRSKNKYIIKCAAVHVGLIYYTGLLLIWHIPSISTELAFNNFYGFYYGTLNFWLPPHEVQPKLMNKMDEILKKL